MMNNENILFKNYFIVDQVDKKIANCNFCKRKFSMGSEIPKYQSHHNLKTHLESDHNEQFLNYQSEKNKKKGNTKVQKQLDNFIVKKWDLTSQASIKITNLIGVMICIDLQPYLIVENKGFLQLIEQLQPHYQIPSEKYFRTSWIDQTFEIIEQKVKNRLIYAEYITYSIDEWTDQNNQSYLGLVVHYIDSDFEKQQFLLSLQNIQESQTGENLKKYINVILEKWFIKDRIQLVMRDNAANMIKAFEDEPYDSESCLCHLLQLCINDLLSLKNNENFQEVIKKIKNIVTFYQESGNDKQYLTNLQKEKNIPQNKLIQSVITRWDSTYNMLERFFEQKEVIKLSEADTQQLTKQEWDLIPILLSVLKYFKFYTKKGQNDDESISSVIPFINTLIKQLNEDDNKDTTFQELRDDAVKIIKQRFFSSDTKQKKVTYNIEENTRYFISTLLDPRYKTYHFYSENTSSQAKSKLQIEFIEFVKLNKYKIMDNTKIKQLEIIPLEKKEIDKKIKQNDGSSKVIDELSNQFDLMFKNKTQNEYILKEDQFIQDQLNYLQQYYSEQPIDRKESFYEYWKNKKQSWPSLYLFVRKYLGSPMSTTDCERIFSVAGLIHTDLRNGLLPENLEKLLFLKMNLPKFNNCIS